MEHVGNFNYGATGKALGFTNELLKGGAGVYQALYGPRSWSFYNSWFDDPVDQEMIKEGFEWYDENYN